MNQKVGFGKRLVLLCNGGNVQGEPARQGYHELSSERCESRAGAVTASANMSKRVWPVLCYHHQMRSRRSRLTLQGRRNLNAKYHATSNVWSDVSFVCGAYPVCNALP